MLCCVFKGRKKQFISLPNLNSAGVLWLQSCMVPYDQMQMAEMSLVAAAVSERAHPPPVVLLSHHHSARDKHFSGFNHRNKAGSKHSISPRSLVPAFGCLMMTSLNRRTKKHLGKCRSIQFQL